MLSRYSQLIVQATNVGMYPLEGENPIEHYTFQGHEIAYDLIYTPSKTVFLSEAEKAGCTALNGERMLLEQAKQQFRMFTGAPYPG
jgi:shikimate 5-dehydrogenase